MRYTVLLLLSAVVGGAAETGVIENTGAPIAVLFRCDQQMFDETGVRCTADEPCHVYLELSGIEVVGRKVFLTGNLHTPSATLSSIVLESADGAATWTEPYERLPLSTLAGIQFIDFERGWIAGEVMQSVPRDPFFLVTGDGGKSWKKQPIFDDDHPGAVEAFEFDSRTTGAVLIDTGLPADRHELYQTMTGGSEWTLQRKSGKPFALQGSRLREESSDWRIRADGKSSTYRIEKLEGSEWRPMARFLIDTAVCKGE